MEVNEPSATYRLQRQRTELGELPADWRVTPLGSFDPFVTSGSRGWAAYYSEMGSSFLRITNLSRSRITPNLEDLRYVSIPRGNSEGVRTALAAGDVLISITADIGIIGFVGKEIELPAYINQHIALVRLPHAEVNSCFVAYYLGGAASQARFKAMTDAGAKAGLSLSGVKQVLAAIPPTHQEQTAIAQALTDALIDSLEQLLTKKRQIKQGAMQELLSGKRRLPGFDSEWSLLSLGTVLKVQVGYPFPSSGYTQGAHGTRLVRNRDLKADDDMVHFCGPVPDGYRVSDGDLLVGMDGDFLPCRWHKGEALLNQRVARVIPSNNVDLGFIGRLLVEKLKEIEAATGSTTVKHLSHGDVESLVVRLPSITEQREIEGVLSSIDTCIAAIESRLTKARDLKQAMAQALLTGRIRLMEPQAA